MSCGGGGGPAPFIYGAASGEDKTVMRAPRHREASSLEAPRVAAQVADVQAAHRKWEIFLRKP